MATLEDTFAKIAAKGWRVLNLFQVGEPGKDTLRWQANVATWVSVAPAGVAGEYAQHKDPVVALESATKNLQRRLGELAEDKISQRAAARVATRKVAALSAAAVAELVDDL